MSISVISRVIHNLRVILTTFFRWSPRDPHLSEFKGYSVLVKMLRLSRTMRTQMTCRCVRQRMSTGKETIAGTVDIGDIKLPLKSGDRTNEGMVRKTSHTFDSLALVFPVCT